MLNNITMSDDTDNCDYASYVILDLSAVLTGTRDERKASQEKSKGEAEMAKKTGATGDKEDKKKRFIECIACGMKVGIQGVI